VYFEIKPGDSLGTHTDSAEEIILVLEGKAEATVEHEKGEITKGEMALIPHMVPHNIRNIGSETLKVVGFFSSPNVVSTFVEPLMPINQSTVGTPPIESDSPMTWNEIFSRIMG
ncbi:cupin domain-containing protein, partial [Bacillus sp. JJ1503]